MTKKELLEQINKNRYVDCPQVIQFCKELLLLAEKENDQILTGIALYYKGEALFETNEDQAIETLIECLKLLAEKKELEICARAYNLLGIIFSHKEDYASSINHHLNCIRISLLDEQYYVAALSSANLGFLFQSIESYDKAISYYEDAIRFFRISPQNKDNLSNIPTLKTNIFVCYFLLGNQEKMYEVLQEIFTDREHIVPEFSLGMYEALYLYCIGKKDEMLLKIREVVEQAVNESDMADYIDNYQILCRFLGENHLLVEAKRVIDQLEKNITEEVFPRIRIELEKYKMAYYEEQNDFVHYQESSKRYIALYETITKGYYKTIDESLNLRLYVKELNDKTQFYQEKADMDNLTQVLNRSGLANKAETILAQAKAENTFVSVFIIDVDYFKQYNDCYGHVLGDECLKSVARVISRERTENSCVARFGGDEFVILSANMDAEKAKECATSIVEGVRALKIESKNSPISDYISVSIGVCVKKPKEEESMTDLIKYADEGLYLAKEQGRNQWGMIGK